MNSIEKLRLIETRRGTIDRAVRQVEHYGRCDVTDKSCLDDPPEHWMLAAIRVLEEERAAKENRRPHLTPPETFASKLRDTCKERGWEIHWNPHRMIHEIIAPLRKVECPNCHGQGRIVPLMKINQISDVVLLTLCEGCNGRGYAETRVSEAFGFK
jgi:hypothetical protein